MLTMRIDGRSESEVLGSLFLWGLRLFERSVSVTGIGFVTEGLQKLSARASRCLHCNDLYVFSCSRVAFYQWLAKQVYEEVRACYLLQATWPETSL